MELYTYQKELLNSTGKKVYVNWSRGAGLDTALATYILEKKPEKVLLYGHSFDYRGLKDCIEASSEDYHAKIMNEIETKELLLQFEKTGQAIRISITANVSELEAVDMVIIHESNYMDDLKYLNENSKKLFVIGKGNIHDKQFGEYDGTSIVDYKTHVNEDITALDVLLDAVTKGDNFYNEYAILNKPKENVMSFGDFRKQALQKLQNQFLKTSDTKDTVLTRKNIIEMIKDLHAIK